MLRSSLIIYRLFLLLTLLILGGCDSQGSAPTVEGGRLDLNHWDFTQKGSVDLKGQWQFYGSQLLTPNDFATQPPPEVAGFIQLPGDWNGQQIQGQMLEADGSATLRLLVEIPAKTEPLALRMRDIATAYRLWVNGEPVAGRGRVGSSGADSVPLMQHDLVLITPKNRILELVLQVSNFHLYKGE